jgi:hypothetical protein
MTSFKTLQKRVTWVTMGPEPHLATCGGCGETEPKPALPCPLGAVVHYMTYVLARHEFCREAAS